MREAEDLARTAADDRRYLEAALAALPGVRLPAVQSTDPARAPFVLINAPGADKIRLSLRDRGFAVRRADTFPGLGSDWLRAPPRARQPR